MKKIVVLVSGNGSNLQAIIERCHKQKHMEVVAVISDKANAYALTRAHKADIEAVVVENHKKVDRNTYDIYLDNVIERYAPDLIVLSGFMRILSRAFVEKYQGRLINIHPSLLPKYTGLNTHQRAIDNGEKEHGTSVHFVTEELDAGPIISQATVSILENDDVSSLMSRVQDQEHKLYPKVVEWFCEGRLHMHEGKAFFDGHPIEQKEPVLH